MHIYMKVLHLRYIQEKRKGEKTKIIKVRCTSLVTIISKLLPYNWIMKKAQNIQTHITGPCSIFKIEEPRVHFNI